MTDIKSIHGDILFSYEHEHNTPKRTVEAFLKEHKGKTIKEVDLSGLDLSGIVIENSRFYYCHFNNTRFEKCHFLNCNFNTVNFDKCNFYAGRFYNIGFYNSSFNHSDIDIVTIDKCDFDNNNFLNSSFCSSGVENCNFGNCCFDHGNFNFCNFINSSITDSSFFNINFNDSTRFDNHTIRNIRLAGSLDVFDIFRHDLWVKAITLKRHLPAFREMLVSGEIDGSGYEDEYGCFIRTIANIAGCRPNMLKFKPDFSDPVENWFVMIRKGDTPDNSELVKLTVEWLDELMGYIG